MSGLVSQGFVCAFSNARKPRASKDAPVCHWDLRDFAGHANDARPAYPVGGRLSLEGPPFTFQTVIAFAVPGA